MEKKSAVHILTFGLTMGLLWLSLFLTSLIPNESI